MASRSKLWLPFDTGSNTITTADTAVQLDGRYLLEVGSEFKGTILAIRAWIAVRQDVPSNALEAFCCGIGVFDKDASVTAGIPDLSLEISSKWMFHTFIPVGGAGGDSTALINVMAPYVWPIDVRSKRTVGFQEHTFFVGNSVDDSSLTFRCAGRMLLLEA